MTNRNLARCLLPVLLLALAACGSPSPSGADAAPAAAAGPSRWAGVDPCSLVPEGSRAGLGLGAQATPIGGPAPTCRFAAATRPAAGFSVGTQVVVGGGFDQVVASVEQGRSGPRTDVEVGGRNAAQFDGGSVICTVVVEASDSTALSVIGSDGCDAARRVAETAVANGPAT